MLHLTNLGHEVRQQNNRERISFCFQRGGKDGKQTRRCPSAIWQTVERREGLKKKGWVGGWPAEFGMWGIPVSLGAWFLMLYIGPNVFCLPAPPRLFPFDILTIGGGVRSSVVGEYTILQAGRSRVQIPMRSLGFSLDLILPAALRPWGRLNL
jgi:hypothetical protein